MDENAYRWAEIKLHATYVLIALLPVMGPLVLWLGWNL